MCGRYKRRVNRDQIGELFGVEFSAEGIELETLEMAPSTDIAPGSLQPVVWLDPSGRRRLAPMRWGFQLPERFLFNTRSETAESSRFWQQAYRLRRCLIPADGFYESARHEGSPRNRFAFTVDGGALVGLAGLWSLWRNPKTGREEQTFSILTGAARALMARYHDRQPAMIEAEDFGAFLSPATPQPNRLLQFYADERMQATAASPSAAKSNPAQGLLFALDQEAGQ